MRITLDGVGVEIDGHALVSDLHLDVSSGEVVGLVGPNGSGKSTAVRCLYRAIRPSRGVIRVDGIDLSQLSLRESARSFAALTQDGGSDVDFTVAEMVALGRIPHRRGTRPLDAVERDICWDAMARADVVHLADRGVLSLSGGERQRVAIARALAQQPEVLILDEPTNHLDIRHQVDLLRQLRGGGPTTVVVLHDLNLAAASCDRIAVLSHGRIAAVGTPAETLTAELIADVFGVEVTVVRHPLTGDPQALFSLNPAASPVTRDLTSLPSLERTRP